MSDDGLVDVRRVVLIVTCLVITVLAVVFLVTERDESTWIATVVSALVAVAAMGVALWAALPSAVRGLRVSRTGSATAGRGGRAVSGYVGPAGQPSTAVDVSRTGGADATAGGDAVSGVEVR